MLYSHFIKSFSGTYVNAICFFLKKGQVSVNFHPMQYTLDIDQIIGRTYSIDKPFFQFILTTKPFDFYSKTNIWHSYANEPEVFWG